MNKTRIADTAGASSESPDSVQERDAAARSQIAPMDDRTLTALKGSIEKWRAIEAGTGQDRAAWNCPLCQEFLIAGCSGCPVFERTGVVSCGDTPFKQWVHANSKLAAESHKPRRFMADTPELVQLARTEREFLESLLPNNANSERAAAVVSTDTAK